MAAIPLSSYVQRITNQQLCYRSDGLNNETITKQFYNAGAVKTTVRVRSASVDSRLSLYKTPKYYLGK